MKENKRQAEGISAEKSPFLRWLDNFWYHYKWHTVLVAFFLIVFVVCTVQMCKSEKSDYIYTYAGPKNFFVSSSERLAAESAFSAALTDGNEKISLQSFNVLSKPQIEELEKQTDSEGERVYVDRSFYTQEKNSFTEYLRTGASYVLLLDPSLYAEMLDEEGESEILVRLDTVAGDAVSGASDAYSVRLGDTDVYKNNAELSVFPADTVVCLRAKSEWKRDEGYAAQVEAFKRLIKISPSEPESADEQ